MSEVPFLLTDPGEGLVEAEIVSWKVVEGDTVEVNQIVVEVETAKSLVELPSPFKGRVKKILAREGEIVAVGNPLMLVEQAGACENSDNPKNSRESDNPKNSRESDNPKNSREPDNSKNSRESDNPKSSSDNSSGAILVGYGTGNQPRSGRVRKKMPREYSRSGVLSPRPLAKPPVRNLAKELGIDLNTISGSGPGGVVTRQDILAVGGSSGVWPVEREQRIPVKSLRRQTARAMTASAFTVPHVSIFVDVDVTRTVDLVRRLKASPEYDGVKVSPLLVLSRAVIWAIKRNPMINSTWAEEEILVHNYVNLGIAAATPRGLIVPNIKNAHELSMLDLARAIGSLSAMARSGHTQPADTAHGTITITNVGVFGVDTGTPILNPGEASIVVMGTIKPKPWVVDGEVAVRQVTTLGGSFDHRVMDGDVASRFLADVAAVLEEPALLVE